MILYWGDEPLYWGDEPLSWGVAGGGGKKREITPKEWVRLEKRLNKAVAERAERLRPAKPSRVARTKQRILERVAQVETVDASAAEQLRELWKKWYEAELRVEQTTPDVAYSRFASDLAALLAEREMENELDEMLILMAVAALI